MYLSLYPSFPLSPSLSLSLSLSISGLKLLKRGFRIILVVNYGIHVHLATWPGVCTHPAEWLHTHSAELLPTRPGVNLTRVHTPGRVCAYNVHTAG